MSVAARKANKFNVENRAHKIISQDKPVPAPKYDSNVKDLERVLNGEDFFILVSSSSHRYCLDWKLSETK